MNTWWSFGANRWRSKDSFYGDKVFIPVLTNEQVVQLEES